jgi:hypothetical protein
LEHLFASAYPSAFHLASTKADQAHLRRIDGYEKIVDVIAREEDAAA